VKPSLFVILNSKAAKLKKSSGGLDFENTPNSCGETNFNRKQQAKITL
jgi:hypothetical protein